MGRSIFSGTVLLLASVAALLLAPGCGDDTTGPEEGQGGWKQYSAGDYLFEWRFEDSLATLRARLTAPTTGWVAAGFDPSSIMNGANLIIGYVDGGTAYLRDDFGTGQVTHASDVSLGGTDDGEILSASETAGETVIEFRIPLDSGDQYDKVLSEGSTVTVIFAYGQDGADDFTSTHAWAETASFEL
jgi:hypothetical protein